MAHSHCLSQCWLIIILREVLINLICNMCLVITLEITTTSHRGNELMFCLVINAMFSKTFSIIMLYIIVQYFNCYNSSYISSCYILQCTSMTFILQLFHIIDCCVVLVVTLSQLRCEVMFQIGYINCYFRHLFPTSVHAVWINVLVTTNRFCSSYKFQKHVLSNFTSVFWSQYFSIV